MIPNSKWIKDWQIGENPSREKEVSNDLFRLFTDFWKSEGLDEKGKTTKNRYSGALHSIGGYLVEQAISDDDADKTSQELLSEHIGPYDGPLICHDNEAWQNEIDMVSRKLHKYMKSKC
ncbi:hypothetical protein LCGC14_2419610 [marine sediment metagenome]|uniref:Uncharacterized protein n=1 Tax=marine sediment metagenome TaxID=412755 RepID=A0A0F9E268_9ZZZZ|nr:hypothetical protein [Desulfobacterales bacterium]